LIARSALLLLFAIALGPTAQARTLSLGANQFATYFGGSFGTTRLGDSAYGASSGSATKVDQKVPWNTSANVGVALGFSNVTLLVGGEMLMPRSSSEIKGTNASGTQLFTLSSTVRAYLPTAALELLFARTPDSRWIIGAGGGYAFVTLENKYEFTTDGLAQFGISNYTEKGRAQGTMLQVYFAGEWVFTDTASLVFSGGYRNLIVDHVKASADQDTITGSQSSGSDLKNSDGGYRTLDLGGAFAGLQFRFYL
jgi:hypothetical protein